MSTHNRVQTGKPALILLGHIVQEMIFFPDRTIGPVLGSPVAYGALMAARLGESVGIVSIAGDDLAPDLLAPLREAGVDLRGLRHIPGPQTTRTELVYDSEGNKVIHYPQKAPPLRFDDLPPDYLQARLYYVATMDHDLPLDTIARLGDLGGMVAVDLGGYGGAHSQPKAGPQNGLTGLQEIVGHVDLVRASIEDCQRLFGSDRVRTEEEQEAILERLLSWGAKLALLTLGEQGCVVATADGIARYPACQGTAIDTTGAGDSFFTAFLVEYMHTSELSWAVRFASAAVVHVIERTGGVHISRFPTREQVLAKIYSSTVPQSAKESL